MEKVVKIGNADVPMRASARVPRIYRFAFGRDLIVDISTITAAMKGQSTAPAEANTILENLAWAMAKAADPKVPESIDEWLDSLDGALDLYQISSEVLTLWFDSCNVTSTPAKK